MIGVTIGIGGEWLSVATDTAQRMSQMTGLKCFVVHERFRAVSHPSWLKCHVIEHFKAYDSFLLFDADIVPAQQWNPEGLFERLGRPFCAVPDARSDRVFAECNDLGIPFPDCYVNGGLTIFGCEHKKIWDKAWERHPKCGSWLEQGALNLSLLESGIEVCRLPRRFNVLTWKGKQLAGDEFDLSLAINIHLTSIGSAQGVREMQQRYGMHCDSREQDRTAAHNAEAVGVR